MKKISIFLLALVAGAGTMFASDTFVGGIWYNFNDGNLTAEVTYQGASSTSNWDRYSGEVVIPSSVTYNSKTYTVTSIGEYAFGWCSGLTSITIPNSVTSFGRWAFWDCKGLTSVTIPNSVTSIGNWAFMNCTGLTSITIPNSVTSIGDGAFGNCTGLTSVTIPNSVTGIANEAFGYCTGLTSVTNYANTPQSIDSNMFDNVNTSTCVLNVPKESVSLYQAAEGWKEFTNIVGVDVPKNNYVDGIWYNFDDEHLTAEVTYQGDAYDTYANEYTGEVVIPASVTYNDKTYSVTSIGDRAFRDCSGLTSVTIPNSVTRIGDYAFRSCTGLTSVTIPNSVTGIGNYAFSGCTGLTSVTIGNSVTGIGDRAFRDCTGLTSVEIPNSVTSIGNEAFYGCSKLTSVTIPNSVTGIGSSAFYDCTGLTSVTNYATTPQTIDYFVFFNVKKSTCVLNVPKESVSLYKAAEVWKGFTHIVEVDVPIETIEGNYTIYYVDKESQDLYNHVVTLYVPVAPTITGFTFVEWRASGTLADGITLQAVYQADAPSSTPAVYTNPANPAQKLIRNGNVYILSNGETYTITGQKVK